ncbi:MAG: aminotransferase class V-fold PLP-dependent enzyme [Candidatus Omnitrophica bacterium]|nr:aminotransferase class V-fold PLP-dependent enzyme [Candidatus Omnitrophota bacterium]
MTTISLEQLRKYLPAAQKDHFFNYAATAPLLQPSAEVMKSMIRQNLEPMSKHFDQWLAIIESARARVAKMINASSEEIAFTTNTSMGLSIIATAMDWKEGDRVIYPTDEFPSNRFVWENFESKGVLAEALTITDSQDFLNKLKTQNLDRVRLISFSAVSYLDGRCIDVKEITDFCHSRNIRVAVDAIQAVGAISVDVKNWGCDFLACGGQKWLLGPVGSGFLYVRKELLNQLFVPLVGWASSRHAGIFDSSRLEFVDGARRFEPGLPDVPAIAGLAKSIEILSSAGWQNIFQRIQEHHQALTQSLMTAGYTPLYYKDHQQSGIVTIHLNGDREAERLHQFFQEKKIIVTQSQRFNHQQLRVSAHAMTSLQDIEAFLGSLRTCSKVRGKFLTTIRKKENISYDKTKVVVTQPERSALVTGASRGLGEAIAYGLAHRGYHLTLVGRDRAKLETVVENLKQKYGVKAEYVVLDLAHRSMVDKWLLDIQDKNFDVLVNNAAVAEAELFAESDINRLREAFEVNYFAPVLMTQKILSRMLERGEGRILNIVTSGARCSLPLFSGYASSKGALWAWSEALGRELRDQNITVTTFLPPHMATGTQRQLGRKALAHYQLSRDDLVAARDVAERALYALFSKQSSVVPLFVRFKLALNALMPDVITKQIQQKKI